MSQVLANGTLHNLLQNCLVSESTAVTNLPFVLSSLSEHCFVMKSAHSEWIARINWLFRSRDVSANWAAVCIALRSVSHSVDLIIECVSTWIPSALAVLSVSWIFAVTIS